MKRSLKVMLLVHPQMRPDRRRPKGATESHVWSALKRLGCEVDIVALQGDLRAFDKTLAVVRPDVVFNLLEEFRDEGVFDFQPVSFLEALGIPFTGSNPRGLIVSRNKAWAAQIAAGQGFLSPQIYSTPARIKYPAFVKFVREHASRGLTERNRVASARELRSVMRGMKRKFPGELLIQEFIAGEDVTVSVIGNDKPIALSPWRLRMAAADGFATERIKFSAKLRHRKGIKAYRYTRQNAGDLKKTACELFSAFDLSGYARLDFRVDQAGNAYFIDVNANPNLARNEDFACAAGFAKMSYEDMIGKILDLARSYKPRI